MKTTTHQRGRVAPKAFGVLSIAAMFLVGCDETLVSRASQSFADQPVIGPLETPVMVDSSVGTCFARDTTPALIETVTEQEMVQSAVVGSDGSIEQPAAFRTVTRQAILRERREVEFETPCNDVLTLEFVASVQRALLARGYYRGAINGMIDRRTSAAIERFQIDQGDVNTDVLTLRTARNLGLVAQPRDAT